MLDHTRSIRAGVHPPPGDYFGPRMKAGAAARYLGISRRFLTQLAAQGRIPFHRLGARCVLYQRADLDEFLGECRIDPAGVTEHR